jgi:Domain of unknown function (DUF4388)
MAIEGPLRELGIHDVFQLLDLSRKTGVLRVSSDLREDEGRVFFDNGRVVQAAIRSKGAQLEDILLQAGRVTEDDVAEARLRIETRGECTAVADELIAMAVTTPKEVERQLRLQIESVVFELMSWREGFFSFEERPREEMPRDTRITVSTESLLMEGARRIDEWSRIADKVPNLSMIPELAPISDERAGTTNGLGGAMLDLLPHEWQVLTMIDGGRDLRAIAAAMGRDEFEIAKVAYGLVATAIIALRAPARRTPDSERSGSEARLLAAHALGRERRYVEAVEALRHAVQEDPLTPQVHRDLGFATCHVGDFPGAQASWEHFLRLAPTDPSAPRVRAALEAIRRLQNLLEAHADG